MNERPEATLPPVKKVLVLHDLHRDADNAAWRGAMLARAEGSWLRILHASRLRHPDTARERLASLAWRLQEHLQVAVLTHAFRGSAAGELRRAAQDADLIVLRAVSGLDAAASLHPLRALQEANRPTLVVRAPANVPYRRVLVGTNASEDAQQAVRATAAMADGREAPVLAPLHSAAALLERERVLLPDLVALPCAQGQSLARRFLALTAVDTLLLPASAGTERAGTGRGTGAGGLGPGILVPATDLSARGHP
jgi:hypothetical protein